jgi:PH (Pleckstrin Homology) domain-containing protein
MWTTAVDNSGSSTTARSWAPKIELVVLGWALAVLAGGLIAIIDDRPGRLLLAVMALGLALASLFGTVARPRLVADENGVTVRGLTGSRHWGWGEVTARLGSTRRLGRDVVSVELDADIDLVVLGWLDLGADPRDVVDALRALRS